MPRRNPIVGSSIKKRLIHLDLMVGKDTRKTIGSNGILESSPSLLIQAETSKREFFGIRGPQKRVL